MSGGKSSSTSTTSQSTVAADASGVITGNVLQGEIEYTTEFGPEVQEAFSQLISLSGGAQELVGGAFEQIIALTNKSVDLADRAGTFAVEAVANRAAQQENPNLSTLQAIVPIAMIGAVALVIFAWRKK